MYCKKCGMKLDHEDIFCPRCGTKNTALEQTTKPQSSGKKKLFTEFYRANKLPVIIFSVLLAGLTLWILGDISHHKQEQKLQDRYEFYEETEFDALDSADYDNYEPISSHLYENSTYKIGSTMPEGEYVLFATGSSGYFCLSEDSSGDSIIANDNFSYNSIISVRDGEYLELNRCYAEPIWSADELSEAGDGMFKIGTHLPSGEYLLQADGDSGYYCVYNDSRHDDIDNNDNFSGNAYVTVRNGQYLELSRCRIVG